MCAAGACDAPIWTGQWGEQLRFDFGFPMAEQCWLPCRTKSNSVTVLKDVHCDAGQKASACALLEAAMSQYEEAIGLKSSAVTSAFRRAEQLLASLPDEERQKVGLLRVRQFHQQL